MAGSWVAHSLTPEWSTIPARPSNEEIEKGFFLFAGGSNNYAVETDEGLFIIDPGHWLLADAFHEAVRDWSQAPVHTVAYTHGHVDHTTGFRRFLAEGESPHVVAQENVTARFNRYRLTSGFNQHINRRQTGRADLVFDTDFLYPTLTFRDALVQSIGGLNVHYRAMLGETDDYASIWIPERSILFVGDMATWKVPNSGNPLKVQRYPVQWAEELERLAGLGAEWLCPGHDIVLHGAQPVRRFLLDQAAYLRSLSDQVLEKMNAGMSYDEILHSTAPDPELAALPHIRSVYNHPQFIVRDLLRYWGGWWDGVGGNLVPAPMVEQAAVIIDMAGGLDPLIAKARQLLANGNITLACHLADWATQAEPEAVAAQELKRDAYAARVEAETYGMPKGFFRTEVAHAEQALARLQESANPAAS